MALTASLSLRTSKPLGQTSADRAVSTAQTSYNGDKNGNSTKKKSKGKWKGRNGNGGGGRGNGGSTYASEGKSSGKRKVTFSSKEIDS